MDHLQLKRWAALLVVCLLAISHPVEAQRVRVAGTASSGTPTTDATITTTDVTTNNASASKHGFLAKTSGNAYDFLLGTNTFGHTAAFGTLATSTPFTITQTWNAAGQVFVGQQLTITKTAAANGSRIWSASIGGSEIAYLDGASNVGRFHAATFDGAHLFLSAAGSVVSWPGAEVSSCAGNNNLKLNDNNETIGVGLDFNTANTLTAKSLNCAANGHLAAASVRGIASAYASLPTGVEGMLVAVTDSTTVVPGATIAGGGSGHVLAYYNGSAWVVQGGTAGGAQTTTATGTQNDFALTAGTTLLRVNNASLVTFNGFTAGVDGQQLTVVSIGAGEVDFAPEAAGSTAANRFTNYATIGNTPLAPGSGSARYVYDGTTARWRLVAHEQGAWLTPTFDATQFSAPTGAWTVSSGQVSDNRYRLTGRTLQLGLALFVTTITGTPANLSYRLPNGYNPVGFNNSIGFISAVNNGGSFTPGGTYNPGTGATINLYPNTAQGAWSASAANATVVANFSLEVK